MKKYLYIIGLSISCILVLIGLRSAAAADQSSHVEEALYHLNYLEYYKDMRTGICYSEADVGSQFAIFSQVPCNPEVEVIAHKFTSHGTR